MTDFSSLRINPERFKADFDALSEIGATVYGGISRLALSNEDLQARAWLDRLLQEAGLDVHDDDAGNLSGVLLSDTPNAKTFIIGSHLDSVPNGGRYDGSIGILAGLECLRTIKEAGIKLPVHLEVINFTDGEGCWHAHLGSRAFTGMLQSNYTSDTEHDYGPFRAALYRAGIPPTHIYKAKRDPETIAGYLELHIEQSERLFEANRSIGVVTHIAGRVSYETIIRGDVAHSGTTAMNKRQDALLGVSTFIVQAHRLVREQFPGGLFNCEQLDVLPGTFNTTPTYSRVVWDCRHTDKDQMLQMQAQLLQLGEDLLQKQGLTAKHRLLNHTSVATMAGRTVLAVEQVCRQLTVDSVRLVSYAGHDAQMLSGFAPSGMVFVPSKGGISHCPEEFTEWEDVILGANILLQAVGVLVQDFTT